MNQKLKIARVSNRLNKVVVLVSVTDTRVEVFSTLRRACAAHEWNYVRLVYTPMPFEHEGWEVHRIRIE
ncbi:MAG: hypothetical protein M0P47_09305 [Bacteroidales bacterium]|nr:hypothetical protein [Bacteroidales bacterium]